MGTWSLPDTPKKLKKVELCLNNLEKIKTKLYPLIGDDEVFDGIDNAIIRIKELTKEVNDGNR